MPKLKTHKGSKKRFRVTASGKVLCKRPGRRHLLSHKSGKSKRHTRRTISIGGRLGETLAQVIVHGG
jgi:large subunit ribosomal protein L35